MNLFTRNSPYYHFLKYLLFLLKHPVYEIERFHSRSGRLNKKKKYKFIPLLGFELSALQSVT